MSDDAFTMPDGARLPYRAWLPDGAAVGGDAGAARHERQPRRLGNPGARLRRGRHRGVLRPTSAASATPPGARLLAGHRRRWSTTPPRWRALLRARYPGAPLVLMGESMGAAVLMCLATAPRSRRRRRRPTCWWRRRSGAGREMNLVRARRAVAAVDLVPGLDGDRRPGARHRQRQPRGADPPVDATR